MNPFSRDNLPSIATLIGLFLCTLCGVMDLFGHPRDPTFLLAGVCLICYGAMVYFGYYWPKFCFGFGVLLFLTVGASGVPGLMPFALIACMLMAGGFVIGLYQLYRNPSLMPQ